MKRQVFIAFLPLVFILLLSAEGVAQDSPDLQVVDAEGTGLVIKNDIYRARNKAIHDALEKAVERVVTALVPYETVVKKSRVIRASIYAKSDEYIHDYRIISETQVQTVYKVNIRSRLFVGSIKDDLQRLGLFAVEKSKVPLTAVVVTVRGLKDYGDYVKIRELLMTKVSCVRNVHHQRLEWGMARLDVDIQGTASVLTVELKKTGQFSLDAAHKDENHIELTFLKNR